MPYSITTRDGITIQNIPDNVPPDAPELKQRVEQIRAQRAAGTTTSPGQIPGAPPGMYVPPALPEEPETTTAGVAGGVTRALALPVAGTVGGAAVAGTPGALMGGTAGVLAPVVADPLVELSNRVFGTNLQMPSKALRDLLTRMGVPVPQSGVERGAQKLTEGVVAGTVVPAAAARTAMTLAQGTRAAPVVNPVAESVRVAGMGPTGGATAGQRAGAGMVAGGIGAAPVAEGPIDVAVGMGAGAVSPTIGKAIGGAVPAIWDATVTPLMRPSVAAARQLYSAVGGTVGRAEQALQAIREGVQVPTTPGFQRTLPETIVAGGGEATPSLAALTERIANSTFKEANDIARMMNERVGALQAQLNRINQQIDQQGSMLQPAALEELTTVRDNLMRSLETEQAQRQAVLQASAGRLSAGPGPQQLGEDIAARVRDLDKNLRETLIRPEYKRAFNLAGNAQIDVSPIVQAVERILGRPLSVFDEKTAPPIVRTLNQLIPRPRAEVPAGSIIVPGQAMPEAPRVTATLDVLDDMRKAVNATMTQASRGSDQLAGIKVSNLMDLHRAIDDAVQSSPALSNEAKTAYSDALKNYREIYAPRFREGETARILKPAMFGETRIMPAQVVDQYVKDRDAALQFVRTFANDAQGFDLMRNALLGKFREAAIDPVTLTIDPRKAASFLDSKREVLAVFEDAGMGVRGTMEAFGREADQASQVLTRLRDIGKGFEGKTPAQMLDYITSSGDRMGLALARSTPQDREIIRNVLTTRLNTMLTQTPGGQPLTEAGVMKVVGELIDETGNLRKSYQLALGPDLSRQFVERANGLRRIVEVRKDPMLNNPNAIEPFVNAQNFTPDQLTNMQLVLDDLMRARQVAEAARVGTKAPSPTGRKILEEQAAESPSQLDRMALLDRFYTVIRNTYVSARDRINPRISAQLANMLYNNPQKAAEVLRKQIAEAQKKAQPANLRRAIPAAQGAISSGISTQNIDVFRSPEEQEPIQ